MKENQEKQKKGLEEGPPMWVESLMTREEWNKEYKKNKGKTAKLARPPDESLYEVKWRKGMGNVLSEKEIKNINGNIDYLLETFNNENLVS